jgi:hypothetical protein
MAPIPDKIDHMKDSFYEELERVFDTFAKYHMKTLLGDFNAKVGGKTFSNQHLGMGVYMIMGLVVNFVTSKTDCQKYSVTTS